MSGGHLTLDEMRACARGEAEALISIAVEHCKECEECARRMAATLAVTRPAEQKPKGALLAGGIAAAVVILAALFWVRADLPGFGDDPTESLATIEPPPAMVVQFQLGMASPVGGDDTVARLQQAGVAVAERRYDTAIEELEVLHRRRPSSGPIAAYLGFALYLSGDDSSRVGELLAAASRDRNESIAEFAQWYHANYLVRIGRLYEATPVLERLAREPTIPGRSALDLLGRLNGAAQQ